MKARTHTSFGVLAVIVAMIVVAAAPASARHFDSEAVVGLGTTTLDEHFGPSAGDRVTLAIAAHTDRDGRSAGRIGFLHRGTNASGDTIGQAEVTCLSVEDGIATLTARVTDVYVADASMPEDMGIAMKVEDGGRHDRVMWAWVPMPQITPCLDIDDIGTGGPLRLPIERGGFRVR